VTETPRIRGSAITHSICYAVTDPATGEIVGPSAVSLVRAPMAARSSSSVIVAYSCCSFGLLLVSLWSRWCTRAFYPGDLAGPNRRLAKPPSDTRPRAARTLTVAPQKFPESRGHARRPE
jgi:hypothetical protein